MQPDMPDLKQICNDLLEIARKNLDPQWKNGQVIVLETWPGQYHYLMVPDIDPAIREPLEDQLLESLQQWQATRVLHCLCTMDGAHTEIPSWHLRSRLVEIDSRNLETKLILQGPGDLIRIISFSDLLPPQTRI